MYVFSFATDKTLDADIVKYMSNDLSVDARSLWEDFKTLKKQWLRDS